MARASFDLCVARDSAADTLFHLMRSLWSGFSAGRYTAGGDGPAFSCSVCTAPLVRFGSSLTFRVVLQVSQSKASTSWRGLDLESLIRAKIDFVLASTPGVASCASVNLSVPSPPGAMALVVPAYGTGAMASGATGARTPHGFLTSLLLSASQSVLSDVELRFCPLGNEDSEGPGGLFEIWVAGESLEHVFGAVDALIGSALPFNCGEVDFFTDRPEYCLDREDLLAAREAQDACELVPLGHHANAVKTIIEGEYPDWYRASKRTSLFSLAFGRPHHFEEITDATGWVKSRWMDLGRLVHPTRANGDNRRTAPTDLPPPRTGLL